jgi:transcriptional regulator with XRE-family HTH domain
VSFEDSVRRTMGYVAANLRALRLARGMTQESLAEEAGIEVRHLSDLENARRTPSFRLIVVFADILEIEVVQLFRARPLLPVAKGRPPRALAVANPPVEVARPTAGSVRKVKRPPAMRSTKTKAGKKKPSKRS